MNVYYSHTSSITSVIHTQPLRPPRGVVWDVPSVQFVLMLTGGTADGFIIFVFSFSVNNVNDNYYY